VLSTREGKCGVERESLNMGASSVVHLLMLGVMMNSCKKMKFHLHLQTEVYKLTKNLLKGKRNKTRQNNGKKGPRDL
jgi:hypothetical protein